MAQNYTYLCLWSRFPLYLGPRGATTTGPDATSPPQLSVKTRRGGELGRGGGGGIGSFAGGWGMGLRATHSYHLHTSRGCLGALGYRGMYVIIAISCLCQEATLKVLRTKGIVPLSLKHGTKNLVPLAPWPPHCYLSKLERGGGGGVGGVAGKDLAGPPPQDLGTNINHLEKHTRVVCNMCTVQY